MTQWRSVQLWQLELQLSRKIPIPIPILCSGKIPIPIPIPILCSAKIPIPIIPIPILNGLFPIPILNHFLHETMFSVRNYVTYGTSIFMVEIVPNWTLLLSTHYLPVKTVQVNHKFIKQLSRPTPLHLWTNAMSDLHIMSYKFGMDHTVPVSWQSKV